VRAASRFSDWLPASLVLIAAAAPGRLHTISIRATPAILTRREGSAHGSHAIHEENAVMATRIFVNLPVKDLG
jgi:hypothetical protein